MDGWTPSDGEKAGACENFFPLTLQGISKISNAPWL